MTRLGMKMKKACCVILSCLILSGCGYQYERSRDREEAKTLQQKRDVLLKWSPFEIKDRSPDGPYNVYDARRRYIGHGEESESFLSGMISSCYNSTSDTCAYHYYVDAANADYKKQMDLQEKDFNDRKLSNIEERKSKIKAVEGDSFICKLHVSNSQAEPRHDSGIRVKVKENTDTFTMMMSNGDYIESPELKEFQDGSGLRTGFADNHMLNAIAAYDGDFYQLVINQKVIRRYYHTSMVASAIPFIIIDKADYETSLVLMAFDCRKE